MPLFTYRAYDRQGALSTGEIRSETREAALDLLHRRGELAIEVRQGSGMAVTPWWQRDLLGSRQLSHANLALFTRELATLVSAEIPIDEALRIVAIQPLIGTRTRRTVAHLLAAVTEGSSLSAALASADGAVPEFHWRLVAAGEASGQLGPVLVELAAFLESSGEARSKIGSALLYPAILLVAASATLAIIMGVLIPTMMPIYEEARTPPPAIVAALAAAGQWIGQWWPLVAAMVTSTAVALVVLGRSAAGRSWRDRLVLRLPLVSGLVVRRDTARFARSLSTLVRNGVPMLVAVETAAGSLGNTTLRDAALGAREGLKDGGTLSVQMRASGRFPELSLRLIAAGEQTGQLDTMLSRVADIFDRSLERDTQRITNLLTPVLTVVIGLVVGGLVVSVMGALAGINDLAIR